MMRCNGVDAVSCVPGDRCLTHGLWDALGEQIAWFLENVSLEEVLGGIPPDKIGRPQRPRAHPSPPASMELEVPSVPMLAQRREGPLPRIGD